MKKNSITAKNKELVKILIVISSMFRKIIIAIIIIVFSTNAFAKGECVYKTETVSKNGKVISSKETKFCTEHTKFNYGLVDFITDPENEELVVLTAIWILTNL